MKYVIGGVQQVVKKKIIIKDNPPARTKTYYNGRLNGDTVAKADKKNQERRDFTQLPFSQ